MAGRPRKPSNILELSGAKRKNPGRYADRASEPVVTEPLGSPPVYLDKAAKAAWRELARDAPDGVLTRADRAIMVSASIALAQLKATSAISWATELRQTLGRLGMTPADRSRVQGTAKAKEKTTGSPFAR